MEITKSRIKRGIKKIIYYGNQYYCPVCNSPIRILKPTGVIKRQNAVCPICGSYERHRMIWLYFIKETNLFEHFTKKMLHIAPESCFAENLIRSPYIEYITADLYENAMIKMDITDIQYPDNTFDVIYCSHVLEHIVDDRKAMSELGRVLKPDGWAILQVPINGEVTFEDWTITDPKDREQYFGQADHVRVYGLDYKNRLEDSGFEVTQIPYLDRFNSSGINRYGLSIERDDIFLCNKR